MDLTFSLAKDTDAPVVADIRNLAADHLTALFGKGHWSYQTSEKGVLSGMKGKSQVYVAKEHDTVVGTLLLMAKKPWAIDPAYFTKVAQPVYLLNMAVRPDRQRSGIGRFMLDEVKAYTKSFPADAIRLDAYDSPAGAGGFYRKCGYAERGRVVYRSNPLIYFEWLPG